MQRVLFYSILSWKLKCAPRIPILLLYALCACIAIGPIALSCLPSIRRLKSEASIRGMAVLRGRAEPKKGSRRTILTTKTADTKAPELLIRQFLCPRRAARCRGIHEDIKLAILYRHRAGRPILRLVPISIIERVSCPPAGRSPVSTARWDFFSPAFSFISPLNYLHEKDDV